MDRLNILTKNGIKNCFDLRIGERPLEHEINYIFQIIALKLIRSDDDRSMFQCTLSDGESKYGCFIFVKDSTNQVFEQNDIIKISSVVHSKMSDKQSDTFIVKKYEVKSKNIELIGNPSNFSRTIHNLNNQNSTTNVKHFLLENLSTYSSNFKILVRVTQKSDLKPFKSGQGKILSFRIIDKNSNEMDVAAFNDLADKYYPVITVGRVYEIISPKVKSNDRKYSLLKSDFRLNIEEYTTIKEVFDDGTVKFFKFDFKKINEMNQVINGAFVDVIGFLYDVGNSSKLKTKVGDSNLKKLILADDSETIIEVSLWKEFALRDDLKSDMIVAIKNLRVKDFNGKKLNTTDETTIYIEPKIEETLKIRQFKDHFEGDYKSLNNLENSNINNFNADTFQDNRYNEPITPLKDVLSSIDQDGFSEDKVPYFKVKCYISKFNHDEKNVYTGCIECKRKVVADTYSYICISCNKKMDEPLFIYSFSVKIKDFSGETYLDVFSQCGEKIIELNAKDYRELIKENESEKLSKLLSEIELKQFNILVKVKINNFNNQLKKKFSAVRIEKVDKDLEISRLSKEILSNLVET